jgi:hypothetical protein
LKTVYQAATREEVEANLLKLVETWKAKYATAIKSWHNNWEELVSSRLSRLINWCNRGATWGEIMDMIDVMD